MSFSVHAIGPNRPHIAGVSERRDSILSSARFFSERANVTDVIVLERVWNSRQCVVEVVYGSVEPFRKMLDQNDPHWSLCNVS